MIMIDEEYHPISSEQPIVKTKRQRSRDRKPKRLRLWNQNPYCFYCNAQLTFNESTLDHVIPLSKGGSNRIENLVLACSDCNQKKDNKLDFKAPKEDQSALN